MRTLSILEISMNDFASLLQQGNAGCLFPALSCSVRCMAGAGPLKTMMAAFIVAIRGTLKQAVLLGLAATLSHTAVVWIIAMAGLWFGRGWDAHTSEPRFQLISGVLIVAIALWMAWRTRKRAGHTIIITIATTIMTMIMNMIITITTNTRWLKRSGRTPTSARTRRISTGVLTDKT